MTSFTDIAVECMECKQVYFVKAGEQEYHMNNGLEINTNACKGCRSRKIAIAVEPEQCESPQKGLGDLVPGLNLLENFVSEEEQVSIMMELDKMNATGDSGMWTEEMSRRVQHFGFPFNYRTLLLDFCKKTPVFPDCCKQLARRIEEEAYLQAHSIAVSRTQGNPETSCLEAKQFLGHLSLPLTQLTANEYTPGQGIAPHTDSTSCFGPLIFILTCGSGITITFRKTKLDWVSSSADIDTTKCTKLHVWLPPRSLLVMTADARYSWSHGIASRKFDKVNHELISRGRRVSLTFRQALIPGEVPAERLTSSALEQNNVFDVYDTIALHWHHTRGKRKVHWHRVKDFLLAIPKGSLVADIGSGDGKYFGVNENIVPIGCDRSLNLLEVSREIGNETFCCDAVKLPLRSNCFDATICIAVLHHLGTIDRRVAVIRELLRITKTGGSVLLQAWAMEQGDTSKRHFAEQDVLVPWRLQRQFLSDVNEKEKLTLEDGSIMIENSIVENVSITVENIVVATEESEHNTSQIHVEKVERKKTKGKKKDEKIDRSIVKKSYRSISNLGNNPSVSSIEKVSNGRGDGSDQLITYERFCHVYRKGELEDLCGSIPGCDIIESGWDKSNWFVLLKKVEDPRIVISECKGPHCNTLVNSSSFHRQGTIDDNADNSPRHIGLGLPQPLPTINLRTLV